MNKKKEKKPCIDCDKKTSDYYPVTTNRGTVYRCANCDEQAVRVAARMLTTKNV